MASIQQIFPRLGTSALSFIRHPVGALGVWDQENAVYVGAGARYVGPLHGAAQVQAVPRFNAVPGATTQAVLVAQLLSDPLREVLIPAGSWNVGFAALLANAGGTFTWGGQAALFVVDALSGGRRATVFDTSDVGSAGRTATTEQTCFASIAGAAVQIRAGDFLCLELGISIANAAGALVPQASIFADGGGPITLDATATANALTTLEAPLELLLTLPRAGDPPTATVTHAEAVAILKEHWPPHSDVLYDWDASDALVHKVFEAFGDVVKLYGYDQSDRLFRELNPLTTVELLPIWESFLGITLSDAALRIRSADVRRQAVLARLRELGPLTLFNLAAIFGQLAGYANPAVPEVLEMNAATLKAANLYQEAVGAAIPIGTGFDASNLVRVTPTLLDGGRVWDTGALVVLVLSSANSSGLHVRLEGPDFTAVDWTGGPDVGPIITLRNPGHAGAAIHGNWVLHVYRDAGAPAVNLDGWNLYVLGRDWGGRAGAKFIWSVYLDAAHQAVDRRDIDSTLDRITQSYAEGLVIYDKTGLPGVNTHRAGRFVPGA